MSAEPGLRQGSGGERMDRVGPSDYSPLPRSVSGTPGGHIGCRLFDDNSTPRDGVAGASPYQTQGQVSFRDVEQIRSWSCTPGPVNSHSQRSDDQRHREIGGMRPGKSVVGYSHGYSCPPSMTAPLPPKLGVFSGDGHKKETSYCIGAVKKRRGLVELVYSKWSNCKVQRENTLNQMYKVKYMTRYY